MNFSFGLPDTHPIRQALAQLNGSQFYRCALQVNPFAYTKENGKANDYETEEEYNTAFVSALQEANIDVIAITDHWRARTGAGLQEAAKAAGITVFPGFEAATNLGHHVLCIFNPGTDLSRLDLLAGELRGITGPVPNGDNGDGVKTMDDLVHKVQTEWDGICIAAHVTLANGILWDGGERSSKPWKCDKLYAAAIPGGIADLLPGKLDIAQNGQADYHRKRLMALINAGDINGPEQVSKAGASSNIKLAELTVEGLRQAFLDPTPRIRLDSETAPDGHMEILGAAWEGGLLDGLRLHFNTNLNVLIGGRGTGKSSILETLRYAFDSPVAGLEARRNHDSLVKAMLRNGGKISVAVLRHTPAPVAYLIERAYPGPAQVRDENGDVLDVKPIDVLRQLPEIYGQHEIAELAKDPTHLTTLLKPFLPARAAATAIQKETLQKELGETRQRLLALENEIAVNDERLSRLPALNLRLAEYEKAGLPSKLDANTRWQREGTLFQIGRTRLKPVQEALEVLRGAYPLDHDGLTPAALAGLPNAELLAKIGESLQNVEAILQRTTTDLESVLTATRAQIDEVQRTWKPLRTAADEELQAQLRALQADKIDGSEYLQLAKDIDQLQHIEKQQTVQQAELEGLRQRRRNLLTEYQGLLGDEQRDLVRTASQVTSKLGNRVRVRVTHLTPRSELVKLVRDAMAANNQGGQKYNVILDALHNKADLSLVGLAEACRRSEITILRQDYGLTAGQAEQLAGIGGDACMRLEELDLPSSTDLELNVAEVGASESVWRPLAELSVGQRATAVLRLLLLDSAVPLMIDQPEDDLDNRFIADDIVPIIKDQKQKRQFLFATHNANVPVLGDADLIVGLAYEHDHIRIGTSGALETPPVHQLVEKVLEGGKEAFARRRAKYNF
ncbi:hypothetical protein KLP40_20765 [Hymenobacter sp. NST-14]|uniref:TrlF family AAA-like ATPase n=1 Tax=Hymenobacter piscis TaxID=2839984 RepID=UPI001C027250|nr:hypothetical protein [Hymenobacter piscis]MBT9395611.1 hypothetical protein [Hymenobacter piscis]